MLIDLSLSLFDSFEVATPAEFKSFTSFEYWGYNNIWVKASAHPDVLSQAKKWFNVDWVAIDHIKFTDERGDFFYISPKSKSVQASFSRGGLVSKLPTDYKKYDVRVTDDGVITEADEHTIAQWKSVTNIRISKHSDNA